MGLAGILGTDASNSIDTTTQAMASNIDALAAIFSQGTFASRPDSTPGTPGITGRFYYATDTGILYYDFGTGWVAMLPPDGGITTAKLADAAVSVAKTGAGNSGLAQGAFSAYRSAALNAAASGTPLAIVFGTDEFDVSGWFDVATGVFTPQVAGYYRLSARVGMSSSPTPPGSQLLMLQKNGADFRRLDRMQDISSSGEGVNGTTTVQANGTTDAFRISFTQSGYSTLTIGVGASLCYFQGELIGRS
jgi:hypothetical protein